MKVLQDRFELENGDKIKACGCCFEIGKIYSQDCYPTYEMRSGKEELNPDKCDWFVEFLDSKGGYHNWKSAYDGGVIIPKKCDTKQFLEVTHQGYKVKALVQDCFAFDDGTPMYNAIVHRENAPIDPYVVCHAYDIEQGDWGNGYYYSNYQQALNKLADLIMD